MTAHRSEVFRLDPFEPAYLSLLREGRLAERVEDARRALEACRLCPRECGADRLEGRAGTCGIGRRAVVSSAFPHLGEEGCLRGRRGSGTVFFAGCGLQSAAIFDWLGREVSPDTYVNVMEQYRPEWRVGLPGAGGALFAEIARRPRPREMDEALEAFRGAGLWRLDGRGLGGAA